MFNIIKFIIVLEHGKNLFNPTQYKSLFLSHFIIILTVNQYFSR
ncbi:hypothetical protein SAMD00020551_0901 [Mesobacillus selenatarsenatis SF-1]|uniref:Uncharacterized protein n=1 Tax=Mesobacillus selenatarsenatis (strain DSM 18680 / JCM 14380 / FERM P-15431 / SF-1) TaxID=1321606 RepID=A0A0A8X3Q6_MESS1|nr:hypothetical protein SAMD00020551_0901 [Mesobacillus selenatarsenatis SF-1]